MTVGHLMHASDDRVVKFLSGFGGVLKKVLVNVVSAERRQLVVDGNIVR